MNEVIVKNIPDNKVDFFVELVENLGFSTQKKRIRKKLTRKQQVFVNDLKKSLEEVEQHLEGKIQLKTIDQLLNEL